jgi:type IV secretion system protein VirD4
MKQTRFWFYVALAASLCAADLTNRFASLYLSAEGFFFARITSAWSGLVPAVVSAPLAFSLATPVILPTLSAFFGVWLGYLYFFACPKNTRRGEEHGSARWGRRSDIAPFINTADPDQNIILSATESLSLAPTINFKYARNYNVLVIGGSGSGKTYSYLKPNLMQLAGSYVVTDPKGTLLPDVGQLFIEHGYQLKTFDTVNFARSLKYNPLAYVRSEKDILKLANVLVRNTKGEGRVGDDFWVKAEKLWLAAALGYLYYEAPPQDRTLPALLDLLDVAGASENNENYRCPLDLMFEDLARKNPNSFPVRQYHKFKLAAGTTAKSILISVAARLAPFDIAELRQLLSVDELELDTIGQKKTALFVIISDTDNTYSFLAAILFYQLFDLLTDQADARDNGRLAVPVRFMLDEFANLGVLPNFEKTISTLRSRDISATMLVQSLGQLTALYDKRSEIIIDCCDSVVFLGGKSVKTTKEIATMLGQSTLAHQTTSQSRGQTGNFSVNEQILARPLLQSSEIAQLSREQCLVLISGLPPFKSHKYDPRRHRRWHYLADSGQRQPYRSHLAIPQPDVSLADVPNIWQVGAVPAAVLADEHVGSSS